MTRPEGAYKTLEYEARYVLAAPLAAQARVLDVGGTSLHGLTLLAEAGAAELWVTTDDPEEFAAAVADAGLEGVQVWADHGLPLPGETDLFDLIVCHDLPERLAHDPSWVDALRARLRPSGFLLTAVANPAGQFLSELGGVRFASARDYAQVTEAVSPHFAALTVLGQSPVTGSLFFDFGDSSEETGLSLDRSLLPDDSEEPGWYVLLFGPETRHRDDLAVVQLPFAEMVATTCEAAPVDAVAGTAQEQLAEARRTIESLESDRQAALGQAHAAETALAAVRQTMHQLQHAGHADGQALDRLQVQVAELEQALHESHSQTQAALADLAQARRAAEQQAMRAAQHEAAVQQQTAATHGVHLETRGSGAASDGNAATLQRELERCRHDKASHEVQIRDLMEEVSQLRSTAAEAAGRFRETQGVLQAQLTSAQNALAAGAGQPADAAQVSQLQRQLAAAQDALDDTRRERDALRAELDGVRGAAAAASGTNAVASRAHDAVGRELDSAVEELEDLLKDVAPAGR